MLYFCGFMTKQKWSAEVNSNTNSPPFIRGQNSILN